MVWSGFNYATTINIFSERILIQSLNEQKEKILKVLRDRQGDVWMEKCLRSLTYKSDLYDRMQLTGPAIERAHILIKEIREKEERRQRQSEYEFDLLMLKDLVKPRQKILNIVKASNTQGMTLHMR